MTKKIIGRIMIPVLSVVTMMHMTEAAEQPCAQETQGNSKWTMTMDEGDKPLGKYTPFLTLESDNQQQIAQIGFDVYPTTPTIANLFSDDQHQNDSPIGIMSQSILSLYVKAANDEGLNKAKAIIDSINNHVQIEFDIEKEKKLATYEVGSFKYSFAKSTNIVLPFQFSYLQQPNCFIACLELRRHKYVGNFIEEFQNVFPELRSEDLDRGYLELSRRITKVL